MSERFCHASIVSDNSELSLPTEWLGAGGPTSCEAIVKGTALQRSSSCCSIYARKGRSASHLSVVVMRCLVGLAASHSSNVSPCAGCSSTTTVWRWWWWWLECRHALSLFQSCETRGSAVFWREFGHNRVNHHELVQWRGPL